MLQIKSLTETATQHNNIDFLEKQSHAVMKNYSAPSNIKHELPSQILAISLTFVVYLLLHMKTEEKTSGQEKN
jgi:hypothetical protein